MEGSTFDNKEKPKTLTEKGVEKGGLAVREAESAEESKARFGAAIERMIDCVRLGTDGKTEDEPPNEYFARVFPGEKTHLMVPHE